MKLAIKGIARDVIGGVDPFGAITSDQAAKAQARGASEGEHRKRRSAGTAGGAFGGAVVVPAAIMGGIGAAKGAAAAKGGLGKRLAGAARGAVKGAKQPLSRLRHGMRASKTLKSVAKTGPRRLTRTEAGSLTNVAKNAPLGSLAGARRGGAGFRESANDMHQAMRGRLTQGAAKRLHKPVRDAVHEGAAQLAGGGAVGAFGAHVQYNKGRNSEKGYQKRLAMQKAAEHAGPTSDDEQAMVHHLMRIAWEEGGEIPSHLPLLAKHKKNLENTVLLQAIARASNRLLPGARLIRSARPMTDILQRFKKIQRRALRSSMISFRRGIKASQKSLVSGNVSNARASYKRR